LNELIDRRIKALSAQLTDMGNCDLQNGPAGEQFVHGAGLALIEAELDYLETNRHKIVGEVLRKAAADPQAAE